jgi:hypothetical protein
MTPDVPSYMHPQPHAVPAAAAAAALLLVLLLVPLLHVWFSIHLLPHA